MFNKKNLLILLIIFLLVSLLIFFFVFFDKNKENNNVNNNQDNQNNNSIDLKNPETEQIQKIGEDNMNKIMESIPYDSEELYVKQLAIIFAERYNTYSNQNNNVHLSDLQSLITDSMRLWIENNALVYNEEYEGVTSQVLSSEILSYNEESATVILDINQTIQKEDAKILKIEKKQRSAKVELKKINEKWLVNGFYWQE
ncbi:MAG: hypothetical protein WC414_01760 [Patescibacteria group bacterium]